MIARVLFVALVLLVMASAIMLVTNRYQSRALFIKSEQLVIQAQELEVAWRHLQSERAELARNVRINQIARREQRFGPADLNRTLYIQGQASQLPLAIEP